MTKKSLSLLFLLNSFFGFSQNLLSSIPLDLKGNRDVFQIVDNHSKKTILFISDKKKVNTFLLNNEMSTLDTLSAQRPEKKYSDIIGFAGEKSNPTLFWSSSNHKEIYSQNYNFQTHQIQNQSYKLKLEEEKYIQFFSENKKFYMLTIIENSKKLKLYVFDGTKNYEEKTIDFSSFNFSAPLFTNPLLSTALKNIDTFSDAYVLERIMPESQVSLVESSKKRKCYIINNQIVITLDIVPKLTQLITINLETYSPNVVLFNNPAFPEDDDISANSFLIDNKLFQIVLSSSKMFCTIKDLNGNLIKEYSAEKNDSIKFKNSEIARLNSFSSSKRVLEETSQFLSKVTNSSNVGISCSKIDDTYLVTIGGVSNIRSGGMGMGMPMGGFGSGGPQFYATFGSFNSTVDNFNSYANRKVVFINCLFDNEGNHLEGEPKAGSFEKIKTFTEKFGHELTSKTIFKLDKTYYLGYYNLSVNQYSIRSFND